jgi:hypothetical protein
MDSDWRRHLRIVLLVMVACAAVRLGFIFYERQQPGVGRAPQPPASTYRITTDDYVTPRKVYAYDLATARSELAGKTAWVRGGLRVPFFAVSATARHADTRRELGLLGPLEKLEVKDVVLQEPPRGGARKQVLAVFTKAGVPGEFAMLIGDEAEETYNFYVNDTLYIDDPHELYKHWPPDIWNAVDHHEVKLGMNELQADSALGAIVRAGAGDIGNRTLSYAYDGKPVTVTFSDNRVVNIVATGN